MTSHGQREAKKYSSSPQDRTINLPVKGAVGALLGATTQPQPSSDNTGTEVNRLGKFPESSFASFIRCGGVSFGMYRAVADKNGKTQHNTKKNSRVCPWVNKRKIRVER